MNIINEIPTSGQGGLCNSDASTDSITIEDYQDETWQHLGKVLDRLIGKLLKLLNRKEV
ncbi:MAG: hypothetical protein K0R98_686 [Rickettsiaceae bacterium]|jgi:hypothetical protein|nr:hypothetical protein [Rickettsiaceae bacterium]